MPIHSDNVRTVQTHGPISPALCWLRYADLGQWQSWAPPIVGVEADAASLRLGLSGVVRVLGGLAVPFTVTSVDAVAMVWSWIVRVSGQPITMTHTISSDRGGSTAGLTIEGPSAMIAAYAPFARLALTRLVR